MIKWTVVQRQFHDGSEQQESCNQSVLQFRQLQCFCEWLVIVLNSSLPTDLRNDWPEVESDYMKGTLTIIHTVIVFTACQAVYTK